jgi:hypothetical protein
MMLVTKSGCHFCEASMPFYRRMVDVARNSGVRIIGATGEDLNVNQVYLRSYQVSVDATLSTAQNQIHASATPTLILVRSDGQVVNSWVGQLQEAQENEVLKAIKGGS